MTSRHYPGFAEWSRKRFKTSQWSHNWWVNMSIWVWHPNQGPMPNGSNLKNQDQKTFTSLIECVGSTHRNSTTIMHQLTPHWSSGHSWITMLQRSYSLNMVSCDLFSEAKANHESITFCEHWRDKDRIAEGTERHTKKWVPDVLRRVEKVLPQLYNIWGRLLWRI